MKMKSFAMLVLSGIVFAASCAYIAPAMADDMNGGQSQMLADQTSPSDSNMQNGGGSQGNDNNMGNDSTNNTNNSNDQASPDTATGDDDY